MENNAEHLEMFLKKSRPTGKFSPLLIQILALAGPLVLYLSAGMMFGYSAIALPQLQAEDSTISVNMDQASWIASMATLSMALGCPLAGVLLERYGRKMAQILTAVPFAFGWLLIGMSTNAEMILAGRFITGLCVGMAGPVPSIYVGEICEPKYRGIFLGMLSAAAAMGIFCVHLLGTFLSWQTVAYICVLLPLACIIMMILAPESPTWLINKGRLEKAEETFFWCRGYSAEAAEELNAIVQKQSNATKERVDWSRCRNPEFWKPLVIISVYFMTNQFSGVNAVVFYSVTIMQDTIGKDVDKYLATMIIDIIRLLAAFMACILTKRYGRRPLTNISSSGTVFSLISLSLFLYCSTLYPSLETISSLPLVSLIGYMVFVSIGLTPLSWALNGELFPQCLRGIGGGISVCVNFITFFIVIKTGPIMMSCLQPYGAFLTYAGATAAGGIFLYLCLPETKGKTLQNIEDRFMNNYSEVNQKI